MVVDQENHSHCAPAAVLDQAVAAEMSLQRHQAPTAEPQQLREHKAYAAPSVHGAVCSRHVHLLVGLCGGRYVMRTTGRSLCGVQAEREVIVELVASEQWESGWDSACCLTLG